MTQAEVSQVLTSEQVSEQASLGVALVVGGLLLAPFALALSRRLYPQPAEARAPWGVPHVGLVVAAVMSGLFLSVAVVKWLSPGTLVELSLLAQLLMAALAYGSGALVTVLIARRRGALEVMGLGAGGHGRAALTGVGVYLLCAPLIYGVTLVWPWVIEQFGGQAEVQPIAAEFVGQAGLPLALAVVLAVLVIPLIEELLFRGFLLPFLVRTLGTARGLLGTSLLFGLMHGPDFVVPIGCLALVLGWVQLRTGRLAAAWAVHALHNGIQVALIVLSGEVL